MTATDQTPPTPSPVPQTVDRGPGIPPYRARLAPTAIPVRLCGYGPGVLVLRCHDLDVAARTASLTITTGASIARALATLDPEPIWVRWVVDDPATWPHGPGGWERELRGTPGATPAVLYAEPEPEREIPW